MQVQERKSKMQTKRMQSFTIHLVLMCALCTTFNNEVHAQTIRDTAQSISHQVFPDLRSKTHKNYFSTPQKAKLMFQQPIQNWGSICKLEFNLEKKIKVPVKFRLGSLEYVDRLEGKSHTPY